MHRRQNLAADVIGPTENIACQESLRSPPFVQVVLYQCPKLLEKFTRKPQFASQSWAHHDILSRHRFLWIHCVSSCGLASKFRCKVTDPTWAFAHRASEKRQRHSTDNKVFVEALSGLNSGFPHILGTIDLHSLPWRPPRLGIRYFKNDLLILSLSPFRANYLHLPNSSLYLMVATMFACYVSKVSQIRWNPPCDEHRHLEPWSLPVQSLQDQYHPHWHRQFSL